MSRELWISHLGQVPYREAAELQESLRERVIAGELPDLMLLLEHPPVYTLGRRSDAGRPAAGRGLAAASAGSTSCAPPAAAS